MPVWNEGRTGGGLWLRMSPGLIQACNTTSSSQCDVTPRITYQPPFYVSTNIPAQSHYPEAIINGGTAVTWDMNATCGTQAGQIDEQCLRTVEDNKSPDKENDEQYVAWIRSRFSLIRRGRSQLDAANPPTPNQHAQGTTNQRVSPTRRA